jgi:hypothetical protein
MELVLCSEEGQRSFPLQPAPNTWLRLHSVATGASLAAGALTYTLSHIAGTTATNTLANTVSITGSIVAQGTRMVAGDLAGVAVQTGTNTASFVIRQGGQAATQMGALVASSIAAVTVGSTFLLGNTVYQVCKKVCSGSPGFPTSEVGMSIIESIEELPEDTLLLTYDLNSTSTPCDSSEKKDVPTSVLPDSFPILEDGSVSSPNVYPDMAPKL